MAVTLCGFAALAPAAARAQSLENERTTVDKQLKSLRVFGTDERQPVSDTSLFPWSAVGLVQSIWHKANDVIVVSSGTGALIGERVVLTGGHCIYSQVDGWADEVLFIPAKNGLFEPFGRSYSVRTITQRAWVENNDNRYDIAMIVLDRALGTQAGQMTVAAESDAFFVDRNLNSSGYPGEILPGDVQYHAYGQSLDVRDGLIRHMLDSEPGQSGSPLWYFEPDTQNRRLVGVLTGSREINSGGQIIDAFNVAIHIDSAFAGWIEETLVKYDGHVQDIAVSETVPSSEPIGCGAGLPVAAIMMLLMLQVVRSVSSFVPRRVGSQKRR